MTNQLFENRTESFLDEVHKLEEIYDLNFMVIFDAVADKEIVVLDDNSSDSFIIFNEHLVNYND